MPMNRRGFLNRALGGAALLGVAPELAALAEGEPFDEPTWRLVKDQVG